MFRAPLAGFYNRHMKNHGRKREVKRQYRGGKAGRLVTLAAGVRNDDNNNNNGENRILRLHGCGRKADRAQLRDGRIMVHLRLEMVKGTRRRLRRSSEASCSNLRTLSGRRARSRWRRLWPIFSSRRVVIPGGRSGCKIPVKILRPRHQDRDQHKNSAVDSLTLPTKPLSSMHLVSDLRSLNVLLRPSELLNRRHAVVRPLSHFRIALHRSRDSCSKHPLGKIEDRRLS